MQNLVSDAETVACRDQVICWHDAAKTWLHLTRKRTHWIRSTRSVPRLRHVNDSQEEHSCASAYLPTLLQGTEW